MECLASGEGTYCTYSSLLGPVTRLDGLVQNRIASRGIKLFEEVELAEFNPDPRLYSNIMLVNVLVNVCLFVCL